MRRFDQFATLLANVDLPRWFYRPRTGGRNAYNTPEETEATCHAVDAELRDAVEALTYHGATASEEVRLRVRLPIWRRGCGIRSHLSLAPARAYRGLRPHCRPLRVPAAEPAEPAVPAMLSAGSRAR
jgi:hypothetical protein